MAGLRTNALVAAGSALFVLLSNSLDGKNDQTRIAAQIVSGVGFLGAGVIMREGLSVRGLNTAATLWCSAAIGALSGFGFFAKAIAGALLVLATNIVLRPLAQKINRRQADGSEQELYYRIRIVCRDPDESHVRFLVLQAVSAAPLSLHSLNSEDLNGSGKVAVTAEVEATKPSNSVLEQVVSRLSLEKGVSAASWALAADREEAA